MNPKPIPTTEQIKLVTDQQYTFPGGYELCYIMDDGGLLCSHCVKDNYDEIIDPTKKQYHDGWDVQAITNDSELEDCFCSHCSKQLGYQSNPSLTEIYEENSRYVQDSGFTVEVNESLSYVNIEDRNKEGFYLQGDEAEKYIGEARKVWWDAETLSLTDAFNGHAKQYIDCL